jgi:aminopeptidase N
MILPNIFYKLIIAKPPIIFSNILVFFFFSIVFYLPQHLLAQPDLVNNEKRVYKSLSNFSNENRYSQGTLSQLNNYDVKFYKLDLQVSKSSTEIQGSGTIYVSVQNSPLDTFVVELIDTLTTETYMVVDSVNVNGQTRSFIHSNHLIKIPIEPPLPVGSLINVEIYYYGNGKSTSISGYNGISNDNVFNSSVTYTYSEPFWSKIWWPCKQILSDKSDSIQISITTSSDCRVGSNGILTSIVSLPENKVRYEWKSNYPIAYYLVSFAVGDYIENITYAPIAETNDSILIQSYLFQNSPYLQMNLVAIEKTKKYLQLFTRLFGYYPFKNEKYGYCLTPHEWGAMEHQTMTTTGYRALDTTVSSLGFYYLWYSAHELGHSWFGDNVTCATWQDIWINEGFASYCEYLALENLESISRAHYWMDNAHTQILSLPDGSVYIPESLMDDENRIFDYRLTYKKGAAIIHMIRYELENDSLFFQTLKNFQDLYKNDVAGAIDFKNVLEYTTGQDFSEFFNQWYYGEGYPIYNIHWQQINDTLYINSVQSTSTATTPFFKIPIDIKLNYFGGDTTIKVIQIFNNQTFQIYTPYSISGIELDPYNWIVNKSTVYATDVYDNSINEIGYLLSQNYPNPFNPSTIISWQSPVSSWQTLKVYDILGNVVATLVNEYRDAGSYEIEFPSVETHRDASLPSGIYFYQLKAGDFVETKKMILLK